MKLRLKSKNSTLKSKTATLTPQTHKNEGKAKDKRISAPSLPIVVESDGQYRFCIPSFDEEDFIHACQYIYYCHGHSLISDKLYDQFEKLGKKLRPDSPIFYYPGSDNPDDYPHHVRALGLYLSFKFSKRKRTPKKIRLIEF